MSVCLSSHPRRPSVGGNACPDMSVFLTLSELAARPVGSFSLSFNQIRPEILSATVTRTFGQI